MREATVHNTPPLPDANQGQPPPAHSDAHPPIFAGAVVTPVHSSNWPSVLGVLSIVLGTLAVLNSLWAIAWAFLGPVILDKINASNNPQFAASSQQTRESMPYIVVSSALALVLGAYLIVAGTRLTARRKSGARFSVQWAWAKIGYSILATVVGAIISLAQVETTKQQMAAQGAPALATSVMNISIIFGLTINLLWLMAYPVFTLIWFRRASVRSAITIWRD